MKKKEKVGVFIDLANLNISMKNQGKDPDYDYLLNKVEEYGMINVARAYGDFSRNNSYMQKELISKGVRLIHCPSNHNGESKFDDPLMIEDIHEYLNQRWISTFILVTGDANFVPLIATIRRRQRKVVVFGVPSTTSTILKRSADEFVPLIIENEGNNESIAPSSELQTAA